MRLEGRELERHHFGARERLDALYVARGRDGPIVSDIDDRLLSNRERFGLKLQIDQRA